MEIAVRAQSYGGRDRRFSLVHPGRTELPLLAGVPAQPGRRRRVSVVGLAPVSADGKKLCGFDLMPDLAIRVENLSKRYLIGHQLGRRGPYMALRDVIGRETRNFARKAA